MPPYPAAPGLPPQVAGPAVTSIDEAVERMRTIGRVLPPSDGVARFNAMYLEVTEAVRDAVSASAFASGEFVRRLDVVFANRYFGALSASVAGETVPRCWGVLIETRSEPGRAPIQYALAGMNAHINHDLVLAVVDTLAELGGDPHQAELRSDFTRVNELLGELEPAIRAAYDPVPHQDRVCRLEDVVGVWSIARARAAAWHDAEALWAARTHRRLAERLERALDHAVAAAGECLLAPVGTVLPASARRFWDGVPTVNTTGLHHISAHRP